MAAMSMSTLSGSAMATTPVITLSSSSTAASGALKLATLRSPASSSASRILAVRASHASEEHGSKVRVALVATGAAIAMSMGGSAIALDLNSLIDNVKELSSNVQSSDGATEVAKQAAQRMATSAARDFTSGDADSKTSKLLDGVKELAGSIPSNQEAKDAAMDIAQNSSSSDGNTTTASNVVVEAIKSGLDGQSSNGVQNAAADVAKGAAQNAAGEFANNAKNRIGAEAGKAFFNAFTGSDN